jgi:hypothetical protein
VNEKPEAEVILHPAWVERVSVDRLAARLLEWDRWLGNRTTRTGRLLFVAEPVTLVNIIPQRSGRP